MRKTFPFLTRNFLAFLVLVPLAAQADFTLNLDSGWVFREDKVLMQELPATVPGTVHTDLFNNHRIPDPFLKSNASKLQWIDTVTWEYRVSFDLTRQMRDQR